MEHEYGESQEQKGGEDDEVLMELAQGRSNVAEVSTLTLVLLSEEEEEEEDDQVLVEVVEGRGETAVK